MMKTGTVNVIVVLVAGLMGYSTSAQGVEQGGVDTISVGDQTYLRFGGALGLVSDSKLTVDGVNGSADMSLNPGFGFNVAVGISFANTPLRAEIEYFNQFNTVKSIEGYGDIDGDVSMHSGFFNLYLDGQNDASPITTSFMVGIGIANIEGDLDILGIVPDDDTVMGIQGGLGLGYSFNDRLSMGVQYRIIKYQDAEFELFDAEVLVHRVMGALTYTLD